MMHTIDPDMVVFGGGMIAAGDPFLERIRSHVKELAFPVPAEKTAICYARLGTEAGFIGAAACARKLYRGQNPPTLTLPHKGGGKQIDRPSQKG
jgi:glucokinase